MRISCPHCGAAGTIRDDLVPEGGRTIACPKCRSAFTVTKGFGDPRSPTAPSAASPDGKIPVRCPTCGATGTVPAARAGTGASTITCPKCKGKFPVKGPAPSEIAAPREKVPFACPQCGREGQLARALVPEGGMGMNCPDCNARFFVRRQDEAKTGAPQSPPPQTAPAYGGSPGGVSKSPGLSAPSVFVSTRPSPSAPSYRGGPAAARVTPGGSLALDDIWSTPSTGRALSGGAGAAIVGAMIWALITVMTSYQIGWMAIGVGALVGFAVKFFGRGTDTTFGFIGAGLAFFGCAIGNLMAACAFISTDPRNADIGFISIFFDALFSPATALRIMVGVFHPLDVLFYILAVSTGYKVALSSDKV